MNNMLSHKSLNNKYTINANYMLLRLISLITLVYGFVPRLIVSNILSLSVQSIICIIPILIFFIFNSKKNIKPVEIHLLMLVFGLNVCSILYNKLSMTSIIEFLIYIFIPILILSIKINNDLAYKIFKKSLNILNIIVMISLTFSIIDFILKGNLQLKLSYLFPQTSFFSRTIQNEISYGIYRAHGILGHSLGSSLLYLIYMVINYIHIYYFECNGKRLLKVIVVGFIGIVLCNSKLGLVLGSILILLSLKIIKGVNSKHLTILFIIMSFIVLINTSYFNNNIIPRFRQVVELGDLTNGRLTALNAFIEGGYRFGYIFGNGMGSSDYVMSNLNTNNLEFPLFMFSYDYGILTTLIIYIFLLLYPLCIFIKNRTYYIAILYMIIFLYANSFNGIATGIGLFQIFVYIEFVIVNISNYIKER